MLWTDLVFLTAHFFTVIFPKFIHTDVVISKRSFLSWFSEGGGQVNSPDWKRGQIVACVLVCYSHANQGRNFLRPKNQHTTMYANSPNQITVDKGDKNLVMFLNRRRFLCDKQAVAKMLATGKKTLAKIITYSQERIIFQKTFTAQYLKVLTFV